MADDLSPVVFRADVTERVGFYRKDGLIYRHWHPQGKKHDDVKAEEQLVLPVQCRALCYDWPMT